MHFELQTLFWLVTAAVIAYLVQLLAPVLLPFVIGFVLAYFLNPLVDRMGRAGLPRWLSTILVLAALTCLIVLAFVFVVPILAQQAAGLVETAPQEIDRLKGMIEAAARDYFGPRYPEAEGTVRSILDTLTKSMPQLLTGLAQSVWNQGSAAFNFVAVVLVTPIVLFYTLRDWPLLVAKLDSWLPRDHAAQIRGLAAEIDSRVSAFFRGQGAVCLILAAYYGAALSIAGLDYGFLVGVLTGFATFIPVVGWSLGTLAAIILAVVQFWPDLTHIAIVVAVMLGGQALESAILGPNIVGSNVGLHPVWLIFALLTFSFLFGFLGLLVAVPVSAAIGVLVRFALRSYLASSVYQGAMPPKDNA